MSWLYWYGNKVIFIYRVGENIKIVITNGFNRHPPT